MKFIDTHSHLYSSKFDNDREQVINNAISNQELETILLPNISSNTLKKCWLYVICFQKLFSNDGATSLRCNRR